MDVTKGHIVLCFHSPFWPPDHVVFFLVSAPLGLFSLIPPGLQCVGEQPPREPEPSCLSRLLPSSHLSHAGQPSAHSFFSACPCLFCSWCPWAVVQCDKAWDDCLFTVGILNLWPMSSYESYQVPRTQVSKCVYDLHSDLALLHQWVSHQWKTFRPSYG